MLWNHSYKSEWWKYRYFLIGAIVFAADFDQNAFSSFQFCSLGRLSHDVGWKYQDIIETLEAKRKVKAQDYHARVVKKAALTAEAKKAVAAQTAPITQKIEAFGVN